MGVTEDFAEVLNSKKEDKPSGLKLDTKRTALIGLAFLSISLFWQVYDSYMPLFLQDFNLSETVIGLIMALDNILALVFLPLIGYCSDNFPRKLRQKFGRRIPFIVFGSVVSSVLLVLVNLAHINKSLGLLVSLTILLVFFMNIYRTPAVSLMPDITPKKIRSSANALINIMGAVGMVIALVVSLLFKKTISADDESGVAKLNDYGMEVFRLDPANRNWVIIGLTCAVMLIVAAIFIFFVKENKFVKDKNIKLKKLGLVEDEDLPSCASENASENNLTGFKAADIDADCKAGKKTDRIKLKNVIASLKRREWISLLFILMSVALWYFAYNATTTWFSTYSLNVLGEKGFELPLLIGNVAAFAMFIPSNIIGKKIGRKKTVLIGVGMMIAAFAFGTIMQFAAKNNHSLLKVMMYPVFILVGGGWATINVHSFVMSVEMANEKTNGIFTGLYYAFAMGAQALTPVVSGAIIDISGGAPDGLLTLLPYALIFSVLAFITMLFVKHGNAKDKPIESSEKAIK